jgi:ParB/RepB/Spo0J family partition protein
MTTAPTPAAIDFTHLPLAQLVESPFNPRTHVDTDEDAELAASIKAQGVIVPLTVRQAPGSPAAPRKFEVLAGGRRMRAAKLAGVDTVPAVIRRLTDEQAIEIAIIDNLQRKDIHPLDEAAGYRRLIEIAKLTPHQVADKIGKSYEYVLQRIALGALAPAAQKVFREDALPTEHALMVSRLNDGDQARVVKHFAAAKKRDGRFPTVLEAREFVDAEIKLAAAREAVRAALAGVKADNQIGVPIASFQSWQGPGLYRSVPWKGLLFSDQYKLAGGKACDTAAVGVYTDRDRAGDTEMVCVGKKCKVHSPEKTKTKTKMKGKLRGVGLAHPGPDLHHLAHDMAENRAVGLVRTKTKLGVEDLRFIAYAVADQDYTNHDAILGRHGVKAGAGIEKLIDRAKTAAELLTLMLELALFGYYVSGSWQGFVRKRLAGFEKRYGIDMPKFEHEALAELEAKEKTPARAMAAAKKKPAKKKAAKPKKKAPKKRAAPKVSKATARALRQPPKRKPKAKRRK